MAHSIHHRGPDQTNIWTDPRYGLALAHCRLSILDLSAAGQQPMHSHCSRYILVFNGEIYNWSELRSTLTSLGTAPQWRGHSDTEVLLACISIWGLETTLKRSRGMFALALWDRVDNSLTLARDSAGEKPLYYGLLGNRFIFASELKAIHSLYPGSLSVNPYALSLMIRYGYVPAPYSIYNGISKLSPGSLTRISLDLQEQPQLPWRTLNDSVPNYQTPLPTDAEAIDQLDDVLGAAIKDQMVADVPLGAFLSGGLDSSTVVAIMQSRSSRPIRTFTIGFSESNYDESSNARAIAQYLGTDHTELLVSPDLALSIIPKLPYIYDEPFGDSSQIPTTIVSSLARQRVTVALSGDGADELFGGYNRYTLASSLWKRLSCFPSQLRESTSNLISALPAEYYNSLYNCLQPCLPRHLHFTNPADKLSKLSQVMRASTPASLYNRLITQYQIPLPFLRPDLQHSSHPLFQSFSSTPSFLRDMMNADTVSYLPDDILVKVDRAAMSVGLETRVPFLDPRVISFSRNLSSSQLVRNRQGKWLIRQLLQRYIPPSLFDRPKQGFGVPIEYWLRGPLRDWAEDLLSFDSLASDGYLNPIPIRILWENHLSGRNTQYALWNILMYLSWKRIWL